VQLPQEQRQSLFQVEKEGAGTMQVNKQKQYSHHDKNDRKTKVPEP